jgi:hypothetical protein
MSHTSTATRSAWESIGNPSNIFLILKIDPRRPSPWHAPASSFRSGRRRQFPLLSRGRLFGLVKGSCWDGRVEDSFEVVHRHVELVLRRPQTPCPCWTGSSGVRRGAMQCAPPPIPFTACARGWRAAQPRAAGTRRGTRAVARGRRRNART